MTWIRARNRENSIDAFGGVIYAKSIATGQPGFGEKSAVLFHPRRRILAGRAFAYSY